MNPQNNLFSSIHHIKPETDWWSRRSWPSPAAGVWLHCPRGGLVLEGITTKQLDVCSHQLSEKILSWISSHLTCLVNTRKANCQNGLVLSWLSLSCASGATDDRVGPSLCSRLKCLSSNWVDCCDISCVHFCLDNESYWLFQLHHQQLKVCFCPDEHRNNQTAGQTWADYCALSLYTESWVTTTTTWSVRHIHWTCGEQTVCSRTHIYMPTVRHEVMHSAPARFFKTPFLIQV